MLSNDLRKPFHVSLSIRGDMPLATLRYLVISK
jgi:hypothetical protein